VSFGEQFQQVVTVLNSIIFTPLIDNNNNDDNKDSGQEVELRVTYVSSREDQLNGFQNVILLYRLTQRLTQQTLQRS